MSNFLVTGGAGFIGSHIVKRLVNEGHRVRVIDNFSTGKEENLSALMDNIELIRADIRDFEAVQKATKGIDYVLHQAALCSVPKSLFNPYEYNAVNIDGTLNLLKASLESGVKRFVFASSCAIYGQAKKFPEEEGASYLLVSPYALTKIAAELYCRIYSENYGLESVCLRYFNVFGPRQALDNQYAMVVPKFITCMLHDDPPPIHGDGKQSRDFVYVDNVAEANVLAAVTPGIKFGFFNIGSGKDYSVNSLVGMLNKILKKNIQPKYIVLRPGDVFRTLGDISKAKKILHFKPNIDFEKGLRLTVEWYQKGR